MIYECVEFRVRGQAVFGLKAFGLHDWGYRGYKFTVWELRVGGPQAMCTSSLSLEP